MRKSTVVQTLSISLLFLTIRYLLEISMFYWKTKIGRQEYSRLVESDFFIVPVINIKFKLTGENELH